MAVAPKDMSANEESLSKRKMEISGKEIIKVKMTRFLADNNKSTRNRALKYMKIWLKRGETNNLKENDYLIIWKGLFYSMWMSDKPLIQEECAENISNLLHCIPRDKMLFFKCGLETLMREWFGIDQLRLNKFLMFVRRLLRQALVCLRNENWSENEITKFTDVLSQTILNPTLTEKPIGLFLHFTEIYLEELSKISRSKLRTSQTTEFIKPYIKLLILLNDHRQINCIRQFIFNYLIKQSNLGLDYQEKYEAWRQMGFPGSINSIKKITVPRDDDDDWDEVADDDDSKPLDPRAGRVDVELPQIKFSSNDIINNLTKYMFEENSNVKTRKVAKSLIEQFKQLKSGTYPFQVKKVREDDKKYRISIRKSTNQLVKFDKKVMKGGNLKNKKRKREEIVEDLDDVNEEQEEILESPKKRKKKIDSVLNLGDNVEIKYIFKQNSGLWFVHKDGIKTEDKNHNTRSNNNSLQLVSSKSNASLVNFVEEKLPDKPVTKQINNNSVVSSTPILKGISRSPNGISSKKMRISTFAQSTPSSTPITIPPKSSSKKLRINTTLNQSQDLRQHRKQILKSPNIPYNANKQPAKPILKSTGTTPINPFQLM